MPKHKELLPQMSDIAFLQNLWRLLVRNGFEICPSSEMYGQPYQSSMFLPQTYGGKAKQICSGFKDGLDLVQKIWQESKKFSEQNCLAEWNYLGNSSEKDKYLTYLDSFFWQNQDLSELLSRPDYPMLIAESFRISKYVGEFGWNLRPPLETMSQKSKEFLLSLEETLTEWDLNHFLVNDSSGSFHWTILVGEVYLIEGSIFKKGTKFIQNFTFKTIA